MISTCLCQWWIEWREDNTTPVQGLLPFSIWLSSLSWVAFTFTKLHSGFLCVSRWFLLASEHNLNPKPFCSTHLEMAFKWKVSQTSVNNLHPRTSDVLHDTPSLIMPRKIVWTSTRSSMCPCFMSYEVSPEGKFNSSRIPSHTSLICALMLAIWPVEDSICFASISSLEIMKLRASCQVNSAWNPSPMSTKMRDESGTSAWAYTSEPRLIIVLSFVSFCCSNMWMLVARSVKVFRWASKASLCEIAFWRSGFSRLSTKSSYCRNLATCSCSVLRFLVALSATARLRCSTLCLSFSPVLPFMAYRTYRPQSRLRSPNTRTSKYHPISSADRDSTEEGGPLRKQNSTKTIQKT